MTNDQYLLVWEDQIPDQAVLETFLKFNVFALLCPEVLLPNCPKSPEVTLHCPTITKPEQYIKGGWGVSTNTMGRRYFQCQSKVLEHG